jgi:hypothetical protein
MLRRGGRGSRERSPCVSTGRSIHAVPSITPSPGEGIQDLPSRPQAGSGAGPVRWPRPRSPHCRAGSPYPDDDVACGRAVCGPLCGSYGRSPERNERGTCGSEPPARNTPSRQAGRLIPTTCVRAAGTANAARRGRQPFLPSRCARGRHVPQTPRDSNSPARPDDVVGEPRRCLWPWLRERHQADLQYGPRVQVAAEPCRQLRVDRFPHTSSFDHLLIKQIPNNSDSRTCRASGANRRRSLWL